MMRPLLLLLFCLNLGAQSQIQVVLENFNQAIRTGNNGPLITEYNGEDGGQSCARVGNEFQCTAGTSGDQGFYWYNLVGPSYNYTTSPTCPGYTGCGYSQGGILSGTWSTNLNRLGLKFKCTVGVTRSSNGGDNFQLGTYIRDHQEGNGSLQGAHYYHLFGFTVTANEWMWMEINRHPQHQVGQASTTNWQEDPEFASIGEHYMDALTSWYWDTQGTWSNRTCTFDDIGYWQDTGKAPEEYVSSVALTYNGSAYSLTWAAVKNQTITYDIRHATTSIRSSGWSSATSDGTSTNSGDDYTGVLKAVTMARAGGAIYFAIRPQMGVASVSGTSPITINTGVGHSLVSGDEVSVAGVCANGNGTRTATVVDRDTITIGVSGACSYSSGGTVTTTSNTEGFYQIQLGDDGGAAAPAKRRVTVVQ